ncbi:exopolysaccharide biosynthesis polyprenyl glycosylphosphotransferase [Parabacteroides johnsonii DSM 18315]|uniref:Exopolysaccharide biosynthesis polyprenyl glycosylphosphotransferase n=1 Tax=Parabacteroides johnsonii DSM 18315 TaxID=537006 RepID=B7BAP0_9BACT|nr:sugar transferase [Parabacteroides johnsonii]EEC96508.1 exopolysaccharide biosynthesis polyprenyl glycosylphosphotransferase [Parabacteroides johnsonii DSM 18315]UEA92216.1 sugar transferase [Parabacteroides johnsonii]UWP44374.1 sugar transferase [Parabacteroides johnsonii DSM 18315]HJH00464.1 sugar transferase [Parabacteroides johnsonii]
MKRSKQAGKYILSDFVSASVAWLLFNILRYEILFIINEGTDSLLDYLQYPGVLTGQIVIPFFWLVLYYFSGYYNKPFGKSRLTELFSTFITVLIGTIFVFFALLLDDIPRSINIYYRLFFGMFGLQFFITYIPRLLITQSGVRKIKNREWAMNVLIVGAGEKAVRIAHDLYRLGYDICGFVSEDERIPVKADRNQVLGTVEDIPVLMEKKNVDEIVLAVESKNNKMLLGILYSLYRYKRPIKVLADRFNMLSKIQLRTIRGIPLVDVTDNNFSPAGQNIKFFLDKVSSAVALLLLSPLFVYIAWRVKRDSPGPVFFRQERIGYLGQPFWMYKFRTMYVNAEENGPSLSSEDDPRVTPFGRVMRKYRLDELPQFWNVLKGDMSLVGPRPERKYFIDEIVKTAPYYYLLHNVRPGITSLGMVKYGYAASVDKMVERMEYDILYYENMSLTLDLTILIYTVKTVVTGKGI